MGEKVSAQTQEDLKNVHFLPCSGKFSQFFFHEHIISNFIFKKNGIYLAYLPEPHRAPKRVHLLIFSNFKFFISNKRIRIE